MRPGGWSARPGVWILGLDQRLGLDQGQSPILGLGLRLSMADRPAARAFGRLRSRGVDQEGSSIWPAPGMVRRHLPRLGPQSRQRAQVPRAE